MDETGIIKEAKCPTCGVVLSKMPGRKITCKACNNPIYKRTHPIDNVQILVNEHGKNTIEQVYHEIAMNRRYIGIASNYCSEKEIEQQRNILKTRFGSEPSARDIAWGALNNRLLRESDLHMHKMITFALAQIAYENGEPFIHLLKQVSKYELLRYKQQFIDSGLDSVKIAGGCCPACDADNGRVYTIKEALEIMPIPHSNCSYSYNNLRPGWCTCRWVASFDYLDNENESTQSKSANTDRLEVQVNRQNKVKYRNLGFILILLGILSLMISVYLGWSLLFIGFVVLLIGRLK